MATPGEMVKKLADVLHLPEPTVTNYDRMLVTAGLRSMKGRGRGAAKVTSRDAARLLTAVLASEHVKDAADSVRRYEETRPARDASSKGLYAALGLAEFKKLGGDHSFVQGIEALIDAAASGAIAEMSARESKRLKVRKGAVAPIIEVSAMTPATVGEIRIAGFEERTASVRYSTPTPWDKRGSKPERSELDAWAQKLEARGKPPDLEQTRRISERTIFSIAELLAPSEDT